MHIEPGSHIGGVPIMSVRDFLKNMNENSIWSLKQASRFLELDSSSARTLLDELEKQGLVYRDDQSSEERWRITSEGIRLGEASARKKVKRQTADRIYAEFLDRIKSVNDDPYYLYKVTRVVVFGSYMSDAPSVSDIDIAVEVMQKEKDQATHFQLCLARVSELRASGHTSRSSFDYLYMPYNEVIRRLKSRKATLSIQTYAEAVLQVPGHRIVFDDRE